MEFLKLLVSTRHGFGVVVAGPMFVIVDVYNNGFGLSTVAIAFIFFVTGLAIGAFQMFIENKNNDDSISPIRQSQTIHLNLPEEVVVDRCRNALNQIGANRISFDNSAGRFDAKLSRPWVLRSYGENLAIHFCKQDTGLFEIEVSSSPSIKTTLIDYGKGRENVERIIELIDAPKTV